MHVAFFRSGATEYSLGVFYATNRSGTWVVTPTTAVDPTTDSIWSPSLALDAAGKAHIAFSRSTEAAPWHDGINHATNASGTWTTSQITTDRYDLNSDHSPSPQPAKCTSRLASSPMDPSWT